MYPVLSAYKLSSDLRYCARPLVKLNSTLCYLFSAVAPTRADSLLPSTHGSNNSPSDPAAIPPSVRPTSVHSHGYGLRTVASVSTGPYPTSSAAPGVSGSLGSYCRMQIYAESQLLSSAQTTVTVWQLVISSSTFLSFSRGPHSSGEFATTNPRI